MLRWNQRLLAAFRAQPHRLQTRLRSTKPNLHQSSSSANIKRAQRFLSPPKIHWPPQTRPARWFFIALNAILAGHIIFNFFISIAPAYGVSMVPTFASYGDWVFISLYYRRGREVKVGDVVSFKHPIRVGEKAIKRVIGMEGDFVLMYTPGENQTMIQVPEGHCWVVGDNLRYSRDSRMFGPLPLALIQGKVMAKLNFGNSLLLEWIEHDLQAGPSDDELD